MIISASRRTDIPTYYSNWFINRIKEGFVYVRNPMNYRQVSRVKLTPDVVDGIVFWTKNPIPMIEKLGELKKYMYYFQFSITPYGKDLEPNIPQKNTEIIFAFKKVSDIVGAERIIWRFDPILLNAKYTIDYHIHAFEKIAKELQNYTKKVTISFIDIEYKGVKSNIKELGLIDFTFEMQVKLVSSLAEIARAYGLSIDTCAEKNIFLEYGVDRARCIDNKLFAKLLSYDLVVEKDKSQRLECGCIISIDIGMYNTCMNGCRYCYANYNTHSIEGNREKHNPLSPLLFGEISNEDKITNRVVKSYRNNQLNFGDL